jgi:hypothetical protein
MIRKPVATSMVEYIVLVTLIVGLVGAAMAAVVSTIWEKLRTVSVQLDTP